MEIAETLGVSQALVSKVIRTAQGPTPELFAAIEPQTWTTGPATCCSTSGSCSPS
jgi:predicted transcriptional regulator